MEQPNALVWNPILRQYLVNAPNRMNRREGSSACPFCEDITQGKVGPETQVWLHPNDFPPFTPPVGEAYVVIYNRDHNRSFVQLTVDEVSAVTHLWRDLYRDLASRYATVMIFENSGEAIGQTQRHPHGQAFGVSVIPPILEREMETVANDAAAGRGCPFCRVRQELTESAYQVAANGTWQAFLPPYVRYPYETHLYPRRHVANIGGMWDNELRDLAALLLEVVRGYNALYEGAMAPMPYLLGLHQLADERFHLHVEILAIGRAPGKLKFAASSESIWGLWTNDSSPVQKAQELREAIAKGPEMNSASLPQPARAALERFSSIFQEEAPYTGRCGAAWAPGRVNLIGEHTDYNDGYVLPCAVDRVVAFSGRARADDVVRLWSNYFQGHAQLNLADLPASFGEQQQRLPGWARYVLGVLSELKRAGISLNGFDAVIDGDVPVGGGMASSAAIEVATAQACLLFAQSGFSSGAAGATLQPLQVAALCQRAEYIASGVKSGILDQAASCLGQPGKAVLLDCRSLDYHYLPFDQPDIALAVIDTSVRRELAASAYNERRAQCEEATRLLREVILREEPQNEQAHDIRALRDISPEQFARYGAQLPEVLRRRAGYVIAEDARVLEAARLLEQGAIEQVGPLLWKSHEGLRDDYEVSSMELDALVEIARQVPGVLGARMLGGGFGGCTINLVRREAVEQLRRAVETHYPALTGRQASIDMCRAAGGPGSTWID